MEEEVGPLDHWVDNAALSAAGEICFSDGMDCSFAQLYYTTIRNERPLQRIKYDIHLFLSISHFQWIIINILCR